MCIWNTWRNESSLVSTSVANRARSMIHSQSLIANVARIKSFNNDQIEQKHSMCGFLCQGIWTKLFEELIMGWIFFKWHSRVRASVHSIWRALPFVDPPNGVEIKVSPALKFKCTQYISLGLSRKGLSRGVCKSQGHKSISDTENNHCSRAIASIRRFAPGRVGVLSNSPAASLFRWLKNGSTRERE